MDIRATEVCRLGKYVFGNICTPFQLVSYISWVDFVTTSSMLNISHVPCHMVITVLLVHA